MLAAVHHKMVGQKIDELLAITWSKKMLELIFLQPKGNITYNYHYNDFSDYNANYDIYHTFITSLSWPQSGMRN